MLGLFASPVVADEGGLGTWLRDRLAPDVHADPAALADWDMVRSAHDLVAGTAEIEFNQKRGTAGDTKTFPFLAACQMAMDQRLVHGAGTPAPGVVTVIAARVRGTARFSRAVEFAIIGESCHSNFVGSDT
ncbi:hypothetical protein AB3Y40_11490 [Yoonia sp. R2331]|uniref:hypothetical protein n=1 Tax=Yoonia sp. R2331 TaxID=3237238 RepID=UPI0034E413B6